MIITEIEITFPWTKIASIPSKVIGTTSPFALMLQILLIPLLSVVLSHRRDIL